MRSSGPALALITSVIFFHSCPEFTCIVTSQRPPSWVFYLLMFL